MQKRKCRPKGPGSRSSQGMSFKPYWFRDSHIVLLKPKKWVTDQMTGFWVKVMNNESIKKVMHPWASAYTCT